MAHKYDIGEVETSAQVKQNGNLEAQQSKFNTFLCSRPQMP